MVNWRFFFFEGALLALLGILAIIFPFIGSLSVEILLGILLVAGGMIQGYRLFQTPRAPGYGFSILGALIAVLAGGMLLANPLAGVVTLTLVMAIYFLVDGISKVVLSFEYRKLVHWGWLLVSGLLSLALALLIWAGWPSTAIWTIGLYFGIYLLFLGTALMVISQEVRKIEP